MASLRLTDVEAQSEGAVVVEPFVEARIGRIRREGGGMGTDPVEVAPNIYSVLFENERVRLLRVQIEPGGSSPTHSHPAYLAYALAPGKLRFTSESGESEEFELDAGQVAWRGPETHRTDAGATGVDALLFELK